MKKISTLFFSLIFIFACGKKESEQTNQQEKKDSTANSKITKPESGNSKTDKTNAGTLNSDSLGLPKGTSIMVHTFDVKEVSKLPDNVKYEGKIVAGCKWEDKNGANVILVTEMPEKTTTKSGDEFKSKTLYGYHFIIGNENKQLWKIQDFVNDCQLDMNLSYIAKSLSLTDLDNNGIAETTFLYQMSCKGDVSPDDMKLMMHEGDKKYALRGSMKLKMEGETYGGEMTVDASFKSAPKEFLEYAKKQWNRFNKVELKSN